ncbi:MAG: pstS [Gammaproteobacteria bacterium]|jgi:phosphate transport system substrate-binding protein|nr:pstS [Gammaproteobacteria bacterium]
MKTKKLLQSLILTAGFCSALSFAQQATGAGSSFIYPAISQWTQSYSQNASPLNYQPVGSSSGLQQFYSHLVDFAATDMPLTPAQLSQKNLLQFPVLTGAIVPVVNIAGIQSNQLVLNGQVLADIYMGKVTKWNDPEIVALNPGVNLPNALIITVHRADGSGTTYNFTRYLSTASPVWNSSLGANMLVAWPGFGLGVRGNAGMVSQIQHMPNSIGYVAFTYAEQNQMQMVTLQNQAGKAVSVSSSSVEAAIKNPKSAESWPIIATTYIELPNQHSKYSKDSAQVLKFFDWAYKEGDSSAEKLGYIPLTRAEYQSIEKQWVTQLPNWNK